MSGYLFFSRKVERSLDPPNQEEDSKETDVLADIHGTLSLLTVPEPPTSRYPCAPKQGPCPNPKP